MNSGIGGSSASVELAALTPWPDPAPAIAPGEYAARLERARRLTCDLGAAALLIGAGTSLRYFTGLPWAATERLVALLLPVEGSPVMICPAFELGSLEAGLAIECQIRLWQEHENPYRLATEGTGGALALDPALRLSVFHGLRAAAPGLELLDGATVVDGCRSLKSPAELALMRRAMAMTLEVQRRAAAILEPGIRASEVRRFIDAAHHALGADGGSTFCAVQFGVATAYPHGLPGDQRLEEGDTVLIDTGCLVRGYHSDLTRSYVFGKPSDEQRRIWDIEHEAQLAAFAAVRPGVACEAIDRAARVVLEKHGLGPEYRLPGLPHRTGHGIGLSIHEAPYLVRGDVTPLAPGMCFSDEPMIVLPERFGIRLEDHFHVTEEGAQWFTNPSRSLDQPFAEAAS